MSIQFDFSKIVRVKKMTQKQIKRAEHKAIMKEEIDKKQILILRNFKMIIKMMMKKKMKN